IDPVAESRMEMAQRITSLILSIRRKEKLKVRQPLSHAKVALLDPGLREQLQAVSALVAAEVNVKAVEFLPENDPLLVKKVKPNFKLLGPKAGPRIKEIGPSLSTLSQDDIRDLEASGVYTLQMPSGPFEITLAEVEVLSDDIPGWSVATDGPYTVALDIELDTDLIHEGLAREFVNRIQNLRKSSGLEVSDHIRVQISQNEIWNDAVQNWTSYISGETLADELVLVPAEEMTDAEEVEVNEVKGKIALRKITAG
ncbi:MAG: isoleucine--tRNA ligase, partial [Bacteroidetes bacterium]